MRFALTAAVACLLLYSAAALADNSVIEQIDVHGNTRTDGEVIRNELHTRPGTRFDRVRWEQDVQAVKDLGIFWTVSATAETLPQQRKRLRFDVEEKWTLLPMLHYDQTGGTFQWTLGAWDTNFLGYHVETGFKVSRKDADMSYVGWFTNPRLGATPYFFRLEGQSANEQFDVYPQERLGDHPVAFYLERRTAASIEFGRRLDRRGKATAALLYAPYAASYALLDNTAEQRAANAESGFSTPPPRTAHRFGLKLVRGKLHYDDYVYEGQRATLLLMTTVPMGGGTPVFPRFEGEYQGHWVPAPRQNIVVRVVAGGVGSHAIEDSFRVGGLKEIRGFPDHRFHGRFAAYANAEYRYPAIDNRYLLTQLAAIVDGGTVGRELAHLAENDAIASGGLGVRLLLKPVHKAVIRFDVVRAVSPYERFEYSLGFRQFFEENQ